MESTEESIVYTVIKKIKELSMVTDQGGALLLGVQGTVVVAHGNSKAATMAKGIALAHKSASNKQQVVFAELANQVFKKSEMSL